MPGVYIPDTLTLKSYRSATSGERGTLTLVFEATKLDELGWQLEYLARRAKEQKAEAAAVEKARKAAAKPAPKTKRLALPPPVLALPKPGGAQ